MLTVTQLPRVFTFTNKGQTIELPDIDAQMGSQAIMNFYAMTYPELTNAQIHGPTIQNDKVVYDFKTTVGVKG